MQSNVRSRVAAAVLFSSVAALLAQPALAYERDHGHDYDRDGRAAHRDQRAPLITEVAAMQSGHPGRPETLVSARYTDVGGAGVNARRVRLLVDGRDVTFMTRAGDHEIRFRDQLRPGRHFAEVVVPDRNGNVARRSWQFEVASYHPHHDEHGGWQR